MPEKKERFESEDEKEKREKTFSLRRLGRKKLDAPRAFSVISAEFFFLLRTSMTGIISHDDIGL